MHPDVLAALAAARRADLRAAAPHGSLRTPAHRPWPAGGRAPRARLGWLLIELGLRLIARPDPG